MSTFEETFNERLQLQNLRNRRTYLPVGDLQKYFMAYLNMARQNCYITLTHITSAIGINKGIDENHLEQAALLGYVPENATKKKPTGLLSAQYEVAGLAKRRVLASFPMLDPMVKRYIDKSQNTSKQYCDSKITEREKEALKQNKGKNKNAASKESIEELMKDLNPLQPQDVATTLTKVLDVLNYYRDMASHAIFNDARTTDSNYISTEKEVADRLNYTFTVAARIIKLRFGLADTDLMFINKDRYKRNEEGIPEVNFGFGHSMTVPRGQLSLMGLVYLICMFLEKKYATMFFDALQLHFYDICGRIPRKKDKKTGEYYSLYSGEEAEKQREKQRMILREIYSTYRLRLPKERLDSTRDDMALGLDMLNELSKCPNELFEHLSPEDRTRFEIIDKDHNRVLQCRYGDRFPKLALQYIDVNKLFVQLRFHITFGKYRYIFCDEKLCADGSVQPRWLQKELNGFGRLQEVEQKRSGENVGEWNGVGLIRKTDLTNEACTDEALIKPYITDFRTQYLFNDDKIGIYNGDYIPQIEFDGETPRFYQQENGTQKVKLSRESPDCYLSIYEIPAMMFNLLLYPKNKTNSQERTCAEKLIKNCLEVYAKLFKDFGDQKWENITKERVASYYVEDAGKPAEFRLEWLEVPRKIREKVEEIQRKETFAALSVRAIFRLQRETEMLIRHFEADVKTFASVDNKQGKKKYVDIRTGRLAGFLASDIVRMMSSTNEGRNKPTGLNYQIMQEFIATYGANDKTFDDLVTLLESPGLMSKNIDQHPFLKRVLDKRPHNTLALYWEYINERLAYLEGLPKRIVDKEVTMESIAFLKAGRQKWMTNHPDYYKKLANSYMESPIQLPRGLFLRSIKSALTLLPSMERTMDNNTMGNNSVNVTYLINQYLQHELCDSSQQFYSLKRAYRIFDLLSLSKDPVYLTLEEREHFQLNKWGKKGADFKILLTDYENRLDNKLADEYEVALEEYKTRQRWMKPSEPEIDEEKEILRIGNARKKFEDCERTIRRYQVQDVLLFLMAKEIILAKTINLPQDKTMANISELKLNKIWPSEDESILELQVPFNISVTLKDGRTVKIHQEAIKIKNYGDFFRFLYDERVKTLLPLIKSAELDRTLLEEELENYDTIRPQIFDLILQFEKSIADKNPKIKQEQHGFKELLQMIPCLNESNEKNIRLTRNAFAHNSYPNVNDMPQAVPEVAIEIKKGFDETMTQVRKLLK